MGLFSYLIKPNAKIRIEAMAISKDAAKGIVETYSSIATAVPVLITLQGGARVEAFSGREINLHSGKLRGENSLIARQDVRLYVESSTDDQVSFLVGLYLRVRATERHGTSQYGFVPKSYVAYWEQWAGGAA